MIFSFWKLFAANFLPCTTLKSAKELHKNYGCPVLGNIGITNLKVMRTEGITEVFLFHWKRMQCVSNINEDFMTTNWQQGVQFHFGLRQHDFPSINYCGILIINSTM